MHSPPALTGFHRFSNRRGAVLLLTVYFTSLLLLILGGIALQRTITESRAAQVSRNTQQAFFLAEGALDTALSELRQGNLPDGSYTPANLPELPAGTTLTLTTTDAQIVNPQTQQTTRQITATGTASGTTATVTATIASQGPLKGVWTKGPLWVWGGTFGTGLFQGDLRSALGIRAAIKLVSKVDHHGALQIGTSTTAPTEDFSLTTDDTPPPTQWVKEIGTDWDVEKPGVYLLTSGDSPSTDAQPSVAPMIPPAPIVSPYSAGQCSGNITTTNGQQLTITDGNLNPPDLSPNVGEIVLCLQYLQNTAASSKVIFEAPTTVYLTGQNSDGYAVRATNLYAIQPGYLVPDTAPLTPSGLKLVVTKATGGVAGKVLLQSKRFAGSIYAPESFVAFATMSNSDYRLENIVARETQIVTFGQPLSVNNGPADTQTAATTVTIQSWTSN